MQRSLKSMTCSLEDGLARIALTEADRGNPLDGQFSRDLREVSIELSSRSDVRAVLITGSGRFFSVGGDIRSFLADRTALRSNVVAWTADLHSAISRFQRMNAPVVCAVHGAVAGGAVSVVALSDIVYAAEGATFTSAFASIGFSADSGSTLSLSARMGLSRAKRFVLLAETLTASEARDAGLVDFVVPADDLAGAAAATAQKLARGPTLAFGGIKRTFLSARSGSLEGQLEEEAQTLAAIAPSDDAWEGLSAFGERRKPAFKGC
jgi:2-(1,2-epoxy-1,2-dihydrophenyl)acetyl-CoA isomerase